MADYIEGKRPVIEALRAQMPLISVLMADNVQQDSQIKDILRKAKQYDVPVKTVPRKVLRTSAASAVAIRALWRMRSRTSTPASPTF